MCVFVFLYFDVVQNVFFFFFSSRRRHTRWNCDWSSDVCSSDLLAELARHRGAGAGRGDRPHGRHPGRAVCGSFLALSPARSTGPPIGVDATPGLGLPARAEIPCVLDRFARRRRLKPSTVDAYLLVWPLRRAPGMMEERTPVHFYMVSGSVSSAARARLQGAS